MKKLILILAVVAMVLPSCKKINEALDSLDNRLDKLEQETIPSIDEQIAAINVSLDNLNAMDKELKGYIDGLTATATNLQEQINVTNTKIDEVKAELKGDISSTETELKGEIATAKANVIAQLEAVKEELEKELAQINATIATLQAKDTELEGKITELKTYVDTELGKTTDWVSATFATLEQYNALVSEVATIKEQIKAINESITNLETKLTTKINEDIAAAVSALNADIQQKVKEITEAYTAAVKTAKEEVTAAYTAAIQTAINALDASLKAWVGEALSNYYTIAEVEAKITALQTSMTEGDEALQEELKGLKSQLETTAAEITTAYKKAIEEAINTNNGVIDTKIANEIATVNQRITGEVATINAKIAEIESRLDNVEAKIAELLARIQSVSYIPTYDDGKATVVSDGTTSQVTLDFEVSPKDAVVELAKVWQSAVSVKAIYTQTRAVSFIDMPIVKFESDAVNGVISITASAENLSADFFASTQSASARLSISDGNNTLTSEYIPMVAKIQTTSSNVIVFKDGSVKNICLANWDTDKDGELSYEEAASVSDINNIFNGWLYTNDRGGWLVSVGNHKLVSFNELKHFINIKSIPSTAFANNINMIEVELPPYIEYIGGKTSYYIEEYSQYSNQIRISVYLAPFTGTLISTITLPESLVSMGEEPFYGANHLKTIYIKAKTPPTFYTGLGIDGCKIYVPRESVDAYKTAETWKQYAAYIEGYDFE